jgi:hypothetical protein
VRRFRGADAEGQIAECSMGRGMRIRADQDDAGLAETKLGSVMEPSPVTLTPP